MTPKQIVLAAEKCIIEKEEFCFCVRGSDGRLIGTGMTQREAWADAAAPLMGAA